MAITGLQMLNEIEDRLGWRQSGTIEGVLGTDTRKLLRLINRSLRTIVTTEQWPMLRSSGDLLTQAPVEQGILVNLTQGSETVTISSYEAARATAAGESLFVFSLIHKEWAVQFGSGSPVYRVAKIVLPNEIKLNRAWVGTSVAPASDTDDTVQMVLAMDRYTLPEDFDRPTGTWQDFLSAYRIEPVGPEAFAKIRRSRGSDISYSDPSIYTVYGLDPTDTYQVLHLDPWPKQSTMLHYDYQRVHPDIEVDSDLVLFPASNIGMIIEAVIYLAKRDYEDDTTMQAAFQEYLRQFNAIKGQAKVTEDKKQFTPQVARARSLRQSGHGGIRWDYGEHFDIAGFIELD